jgi:hypothetical protein
MRAVPAPSSINDSLATAGRSSLSPVFPSPSLSATHPHTLHTHVRTHTNSEIYTSVPCIEADEADEVGSRVRILVEAESCLGNAAAERVIQPLRDEERLAKFMQELVLGDGSLGEFTGRWRTDGWGKEKRAGEKRAKEAERAGETPRMNGRRSLYPHKTHAAHTSRPVEARCRNRTGVAKAWGPRTGSLAPAAMTE